MFHTLISQYVKHSKMRKIKNSVALEYATNCLVDG